MRLFGTEKYPKGPSFTFARKIVKDLGIGRLRFKVPLPKPPFGGTWATEPDAFDLYSEAGYEIEETWWNKKRIEALARLRIYSSSWGFRGLPVIQGHAGHMNFMVDVNHVKDLPANESLYDPAVMAKELLRNLELCVYSEVSEGFTDAMIDRSPDLWPEVLGPVNSQWLERNGSDWLYAEEQPLSRMSYVVTWCAAIAHDRYLSFAFMIKRSSFYGQNAYRIEQRVRPDTFLGLMHNIMDSVVLELSDDMKAERDRILGSSGAEKAYPVIEFTPEQLKVAKHVLYMQSPRKLEDGEDKWAPRTNRLAPREEVEAFLDERVTFKPLPGSYPRGEIIHNRVPVLPLSVEVDSLPQSAVAQKSVEAVHGRARS